MFSKSNVEARIQARTQSRTQEQSQSQRPIPDDDLDRAKLVTSQVETTAAVTLFGPQRQSQSSAPAQSEGARSIWHLNSHAFNHC